VGGVCVDGDAGGATGAAEPAWGGCFGEVTDEATPAISVATDLPALATSVSTPTALFITLIVPPIILADIFPARSVSSTPSANRLSGFGAVDSFGAYFDSRKSM
jgi:hypothetical protein